MEVKVMYQCQGRVAMDQCKEKILKVQQPKKLLLQILILLEVSKSLPKNNPISHNLINMNKMKKMLGMMLHSKKEELFSILLLEISKREIE
jgi:hypothetical protein